MSWHTSRRGQLAVHLLLLGLLGVTSACGGRSTPAPRPPQTAKPSRVMTAIACPAGVVGANTGASLPPSDRTHAGTPGAGATDAVDSDLSGGTIYALLADNRLVATRARDGTQIVEYRLAPPPAPASDPGRYLALSRDGSQLIALTLGAPGQQQSVALVDVATARLRAIHPLIAPGVTFRSLAVGPRSGRLYVFGNRPADARTYPPPAGPPRFCSAATSVIVGVFDPDSGAMQDTWVAREADGYDWQVYRGEVASDERALLISYHGPDTTGIDQFEMVGDRLLRCGWAGRPNVGCIGAHGGFSTYREGLLVATGTPLILEVSAEAGGAVRRSIATGLENTHLMEFAVDLRADRLYAVGSCGFAPGFSAIDLRTGEADVAFTAQRPGPCGERLALGADDTLVVGQAGRAVPRAAVPGALLVLDRRTGHVRWTTATPAEPIDVLAIGAP